MKRLLRKSTSIRLAFLALGLLSVIASVIVIIPKANAAPISGDRLISLHENGHDRGILTNASTLRDVFNENGIILDDRDLVEPGIDEPLVGSHYEVNIYRARPVTIVDGATRMRIMTPYQTPKQIAANAGIALRDEDIADMDANRDMVRDGAGLTMTIKRATAFNFTFYGTKMTSYTQAATVGDMLKLKEIVLAPNDVVSVPLETPITAGMKVQLWRNGVQTITRQEKIDFKIEEVEDSDQEVGYKKVKTEGEQGRRTVTYEVHMKNGKVIKRKEIQSVVTEKAVKQIVIIGVKPSGDGLSLSKGVNFFKDSKGVIHRETYYDLRMSAVMGNCGQQGYYKVRADGVKVDRNGYIIIAASLSRYPRCSVVDTSLGRAKVYDTGGFVSVHPDGYDLATDWSNRDGR